MPVDSPPVAFYFRLTLGGAAEPLDTSFQEVSGLESEIDIETVVEGGENRFVHRLPKAVKHPNLILKRGIAVSSSPLVKWCQDVFDSGLAKPIEPRELLVSLMNEWSTPIRAWSIERAYPVKWSIDSFNSTNNEVAIETIELAYTTLKRVI